MLCAWVGLGSHVLATALPLRRCAGPAASPTRTAAPHALRAAHCGPPPRPPEHRSDLKVLPTDSISGCPAGRGPPPREPAPLRLQPKCWHTRDPPSLRSHARPTPLPGAAPAGRTRASAGPRAASLLRCTGPTQSPAPRRAPWKPPPPPPPFTCFRKELHLRVDPGLGPQRRVPGSQGPGEATEDPGSAGLSQSPRSRERSRSPRLSLASSCLSLLLPQVLNTHMPRVQLYKSCSSFPYHN